MSARRVHLLIGAGLCGLLILASAQGISEAAAQTATPSGAAVVPGGTEFAPPRDPGPDGRSKPVETLPPGAAGSSASHRQAPDAAGGHEIPPGTALAPSDTAAPPPGTVGTAPAGAGSGGTAPRKEIE